MSDEKKWMGYKWATLLRRGSFRRYIVGSLISDSGTWMQMMAQSWVMSSLTSKAILLGLVNFAAGLPALALLALSHPSLQFFIAPRCRERHATARLARRTLP